MGAAAQEKSLVAGIVKPDGGFRVVVGSHHSLVANCDSKERMFVVPGLYVEEPVPWGQAQVDVIRAAQRHVVRTLAPVNPCGECRQCCKTLYIDMDGLKKASHQWCSHADSEVGCSIYWKRPGVCKRFKCLWLRSQATDTPMAAELRPDRSQVILTGPEENDPEGTICIHPDTPAESVESCQMTAAMKTWLDTEEAKGAKPRIITYYYGERK